VTRFAWAFAAVLVASSAVCARQNGKIPNFQPTEKGAAQPIPSWNIHGLAETIPNLTVRTLQETSRFRSPAVPTPQPRIAPRIMSKNGSSIRYVSADAYPNSGKTLKDNLELTDGQSAKVNKQIIGKSR
jgi:hypothetical protein